MTIPSPVYNHSLIITELLVGTNEYTTCDANIFRHICNHGLAITWFCLRILAGSCPLGSAVAKQRRATSLPASNTPSDSHWYYRRTLTPAIVCGSSLFPGIVCTAPENLCRACENLHRAQDHLLRSQGLQYGKFTDPILTAAVGRYCWSSLLLQPALSHPFHALIHNGTLSRELR